MCFSCTVFGEEQKWRNLQSNDNEKDDEFGGDLTSLV